jgi:hypothetical protein
MNLLFITGGGGPLLPSFIRFHTTSPSDIRILVLRIRPLQYWHLVHIKGYFIRAREQYISEVENGSERAPLIRKSIVERYPDQKTDLRGRLIELAVGADETLTRRVENEFNYLY